jgi:hypothetical protein
MYIAGSGTTGNQVQGNRIGTNAAGTAALGNTSYGIDLRAPQTTIGGTAAGAGNVISGNGTVGIQIFGSDATANVIQGNRIGTDASGTVNLGNTSAGVLLAGGAAGNTVGGTVAGAGNVIMGNKSRGITVSGAATVRNAIRQNSIFQNSSLGIDLNGDGVTANDADDPDTGPNQLQNFPVMTSAVLSGTTLTISYSVSSSIANSAYPLAVEFFRADADGQEGQTYLGGKAYLAPGGDTVALTVSGVSPGQLVVATATDANGNTSEFSSSTIVTEALLAPSAADVETSQVTALDEPALTRVVWQAIAAWESVGLDAARVAILQSLSVEIADLPGRYLGWAAPDRIVLDIDAAGYGWYVAGESDIANLEFQMDLLSAVLHEMGHVLGLADLDEAADLMGRVLQPGTQYLPTAAHIDRILAGDDWLDVPN